MRVFKACALAGLLLLGAQSSFAQPAARTAILTNPLKIARPLPSRRSAGIAGRRERAKAFADSIWLIT